MPDASEMLCHPSAEAGPMASLPLTPMLLACWCPVIQNSARKSEVWHPKGEGDPPA